MNKITKEFLESEIISVEYNRLQGTLTHCAITTKSGFVFTSESACVDPNNFDKEIGEQIAYENAFEKMWLPYGFWLHQKIRDEAVPDQRMNGGGEPNETPVAGGNNTNKYRKKPVVIEAIQFDGTNSQNVLNFMGNHESIDGHSFVMGENVFIPTLEGMMTANVGDYIIKGVNGEFYPCKPDIFAKTYEKVEHEQATWLHQKMHDEARKAGGNNIEDALPKTKYMDFGQAVRVVKNGIRVSRAGWNGKGMFLIFIRGEAVVECIKWRYGDPTPDSTLKVLDSIYMRTAQGDLVPWLPSQTDVLAEELADRGLGITKRVEK